MKKLMKAAVYQKPNVIKIEEVPIPQIGPNDYLLNVKVCGLCKTDVKKIRGVILGTKGVLRGPRVFGHEIVGRIVKVGRNIRSLKVGDRVAIFHHVPCLDCFYCARQEFTQCKTYRTIDTTAGIGEPSGGGFAEYIRVPFLVAKYGTIRIPNDVDYEQAVCVEPINCCLKAIRRAGIKKGDTVAVLGQGPIGITLNQLVKLMGAKTVIAVDLVHYRLKLALKYGADYVVNAAKQDVDAKIKQLTEYGVDKAIIAVESTSAVNTSLRLVRGGGTIVFFSEFGGEQDIRGQFSQTIDIIYGKELNIHGCYSSSYLDHDLAAELVFKNKIATKQLISHKFPLEKLYDAVELADKRRGIDWEGESFSKKPQESFKIIITI